MENIKMNYKDLLSCYEVASKHYEEGSSIKLLTFIIKELEWFERRFIELYSIEELLELQAELGSQGYILN